MITPIAKITGSNEIAKRAPTIDLSKIEQLLIRGDLSVLSDAQRVDYYRAVCEAIGLNYLTKPFDYITLNGKLVLYANKGCAEQLRQVHSISIKITQRETVEGVYVVYAAAQGIDGRMDESTGAVTISNLKGEALANAFMKAETKAKRRVTLSICGLNMLDETEVASLPKHTVYPSEPEAGDGVHNPNMGYRIPFGKYSRRALEEVPIDDLRSYIAYIEKKAEKDGKPIIGTVKDFIERAEGYIGAFENEMNIQTEPGSEG